MFIRASTGEAGSPDVAAVRSTLSRQSRARSLPVCGPGVRQPAARAAGRCRRRPDAATAEVEIEKPHRRSAESRATRRGRAHASTQRDRGRPAEAVAARHHRGGELLRRARAGAVDAQVGLPSAPKPQRRAGLSTSSAMSTTRRGSPGQHAGRRVVGDAAAQLALVLGVARAELGAQRAAGEVVEAHAGAGRVPRSSGSAAARPPRRRRPPAGRRRAGRGWRRRASAATAAKSASAGGELVLDDAAQQRAQDVRVASGRSTSTSPSRSRLAPARRQGQGRAVRPRDDLLGGVLGHAQAAGPARWPRRARSGRQLELGDQRLPAAHEPARPRAARGWR